MFWQQFFGKQNQTYKTLVMMQVYAKNKQYNSI